jgi:hypothetical protein
MNYRSKEDPILRARMGLKQELGELLLRLQGPLPMDLRMRLWAQLESKLRAYADQTVREPNGT